MQRLISLAAGVLPEHPPETVVRAGATAGYRAVGLRIDGQDWTPARIATLRAEIANTGVTVLDAEVLWIRPGPFDDALLRLVDVAVALGARNLLVVSSDADHAATADKFGRICDRAAQADLPVSLEFGHFSGVHTIGAAAAILAAAGRANGRVLVDPLHLSRSRGTVEQVHALPAPLFSYAQFCDAPAAMPAPEDFDAIREEALDGRSMLGDGALPLRALLDGWASTLPLSIELRSKALRDSHPDPVDRARHLLERTRAWMAANDRP